jgi:hypothetical protein
VLDGTGTGGWYLTLVDDATQETSDSASFNILTPDSLNDFIGPYSPPVLGQDYTFNWSPSTTPTISIFIIKAVPYSTVNITLAGLTPLPDVTVMGLISLTRSYQEFWLIHMVGSILRPNYNSRRMGILINQRRNWSCRCQHFSGD